MFRIATNTLILIAMALGAESCQQQAKGSQYGGIYKFGDTQKQEGAHGEAYIYPENDSTLLFYVYVNNGAPSYNSGSMDGRITVSKGEGVFRKRFNFEELDCRLDFRFAGDTLTIAEDSRDCGCGFGHSVYIDDVFTRTSTEIPQYYTTISGDKIYFSQWHEAETQPAENMYPKIDSRFIDCFPSLTLGRYDDNRRAIPQDVLQELLPDLFDPGTQAKLYAVGKISGYRGLNLFVCDYEENNPDEDSYDNHVDGVRWLLLYDRNGFPLQVDEEGETERVMYTMSYHYYGEGGEGNYRGYFDQDTCVVYNWRSSESESATGYGTPLVSAGKERWTITPSGEKVVSELSVTEFSSPFYDYNYLQKQDWSEVADEGSNQVYPTVDGSWSLFTRDSIRLTFHVERIDGVLMPVFETVLHERGLADRYLVGSGGIVTPDTLAKSREHWAVVKTSDGDLMLTPGGKLLLNGGR